LRIQVLCSTVSRRKLARSARLIHLPGLSVQEAMLRHRSLRIRGVLAARPQVDPAVRAVLVFDRRWLG
jgi:hypothetical protein